MWQQEFIWFFAIFHQEFRKNNAIAFEVLRLFAIIWAGSKSFHNQLRFVLSGCVHCATQRHGVESASSCC